MAIPTLYDTKQVSTLLLELLSIMGLKPLVLRHWRVYVDEDYATYTIRVRLRWRDHCIDRRIDRDELNLNHKEAIEVVAHEIVSQLWVFNQAEDEQHMEALALLARRPTKHVHRE